MKYTTIQWLAAVALCAALAGCGEDGETAASTGVDTSTGAGGAPKPGRLQFSASSIAVAENAGNATVTITRTEGSDGAVSVTVTSRNGIATQPQDYTAVSTTVSFAAGDATAKTINVPVINDTADETDETLYVSLASPTGNAALGANSELLITIGDDDIATPTPSRAAIAINADGQLHIDWTASSGATTYRVLKDPNGTGAFTQLGADLPAAARATDVDVVLITENWASAQYAIAACNAAGCTQSNALSVAGLSQQLIGYLKASDSDDYEYFGSAVALSADGNTLAVGAPQENSAATGIGGDPDDCDSGAAVNCAYSSGAVYVYTRTGRAWSSAVFIKASDTANSDQFGADVSLSADGNTLAVGAFGKDSYAGAVYLFTRSGGTWQQTAYLKAADAATSDYFGTSVALNADGSMLAVGASNRTAGAVVYAGGVYLFNRSGANWTPGATLIQPTPIAGSSFGKDVAVAGTASAPVVAVGAPDEDEQSTATPPTLLNSVGAAYVFRLNGATWTSTRVANPTPQNYDYFGAQVALGANSTMLAVSASSESFVPTDPLEPTIDGAGSVYIYTDAGAAWTQDAHLYAPNMSRYASFGAAIAFSADGNALAVGAPAEDGTGMGVEATANTDGQNSGAAYVFTRSATTWSTGRYIKATNTQNDDSFGAAVALSGDGNTLAVGAEREDTDADNFNGNQFSDCGGAFTNCASYAGSAYVY